MRFCRLCLTALLCVSASAQKRHNVILFVADGLRRSSVTAEDMPTFLRLRTAGVDFSNSHSVFPTFTTANASVIATGHGLGDTGDYSNSIYPGVWLTKPDVPEAYGSVAPFLENDEVLADMNAAFQGNYLGEQTLLTAARQQGFNVASVGKLGPTAIQQSDSLGWTQMGYLSAHGAIIVDDSTGQTGGIDLPSSIREAIVKAGLSLDAPLRTNGYGDSSQANNAFTGDAATPGALAPNHVQQQWLADVTTKVLLPRFATEAKPFVLLFWSRDPDGTQHNEGDSLQQLTPGINGDTSRLGLRNADHCLKQLLDWLDAHPAIKAETDVLVTSDHGFATISRREIASDGSQTAEPSSGLDYKLSGKEKTQPKGTLPSGFLGVDLAVRGHMRLFDAYVRAASGTSVYAELALGGELSQHPSNGSALLGNAPDKPVERIDGSDARLLVVSNGGSDLLYVPSKDPKIIRETLDALAQLDYIGGVFVDDFYCPAAADCPGALPLSSVGLVGASKVPRPAVVVTYKHFFKTQGDLQSGVQLSDTTLQEGQGMHGGFGRDQTFNNMAAIGPDFKRSFVDPTPMGNIDIAPTFAKLLGLQLKSTGTLTGRVLTEALAGGPAPTPGKPEIKASEPAASGVRTLLQFQQHDGVRYYDQACLAAANAAACP
jgi:hypothetical protein